MATLGGGPVPAQDAQSVATAARKAHRCFDQPGGGRAAIKSLPEAARFWLNEDAVFIITPEERCAFLHLNTDEQRNQFIAQFWNRRSSNPDSPNNDFKAEHYRRIAFANEKYGGEMAGWKTDRGRLYIVFGPPDSIEVHKAAEKTDKPRSEGPEAYRFPTEEWHYRYVRGAGEDVDIEFRDSSGTGNYRLVLPETSDSLAHVEPHRSNGILAQLAAAQSAEKTEIHERPVATSRLPFKDLEAIVVAQLVRDQVRFRHRFEFLPTTHATTLARLHVALSQEGHSQDANGTPAASYALFVRVSEPSGRVAETAELTAGGSAHDGEGQPPGLNVPIDIPLAPGIYQLAIVAENFYTGDVGVVRANFAVSAYDDLAKN